MWIGTPSPSPRSAAVLMRITSVDPCTRTYGSDEEGQIDDTNMDVDGNPSQLHACLWSMQQLRAQRVCCN